MHTASASPTTSCQWCGCTHQGKCSLVKAIEYYESGGIKRVEFFGALPEAMSHAINLSPQLVVKVDCAQGKAVDFCRTALDVANAVVRFLASYPNETVLVYRDTHAKDCECARCVSTVIEDGVEISRDGSPRMSLHKIK